MRNLGQGNWPRPCKHCENGPVIYLDNNASTRIDQRVLDGMLPWFRDHWANPANVLHEEGRRARSAVRSAVDDISAFIGCSPDELVLTSGASEANVTAVMGARAGGNLPDQLVVSGMEHQSAWAPALRLDARGIPLRTIEPNPQGFISSDCLSHLELTPGSLLSLQWVNSDTGVINDIPGIAEHVKAFGSLLHVDAVQALGRLPIDLSRCPADLVTISAHKIHGPKGIGALFVRKGVVIEPLIPGGSRQNRLRSGTTNVPAAVGFGMACRILQDEAERDSARIRILRDTLENAVCAQIEGTVVIGLAAPRICNTTMLGWHGLDHEDIARDLGDAGICVGSGAACSTEDPFGSRTLRAMKVDPDVIPSCIRLSLGRDNTADEITSVVRELARIVRDM